MLSPSAIQVCEALGKSEFLESFYLAGGTGLALQLGHRKSDALDFFSSLEMNAATQATWSIRDTRISFIGYPFPLLYPLEDAGMVLPELRGIGLACSREIAAMKAYALGRRAAARDYVDLYFVIVSGTVTLEGIIKDARRKFIIEGECVFSPKLFLEQLCYTKDLEDVDAALRLVSQPGVTLDTVEAFLRQEAKRFLERSTGQPPL